MEKLIAQDLRRSLEKKMEKNRRTDEHKKVHASGVFDICARRHALADKEGIQVGKQKIGGPLAMTFEIGSKIQDIVLEHLPTVAVGKWECAGCGHTIWSPFPKKCTKCKGIIFKYHEASFKYKAGKFEIVCHHDGFVMKNPTMIYPLEVKSIKVEEFEKLTGPLLSHHYQVTSGLWLAKHDKKHQVPYKISTAKAYIIYISKAHKMPPWKIFEVKPHPVAVKVLNDTVKELKAYSKTGKLPKRICNDTRHLCAKKCGIVGTCFG